MTSVVVRGGDVERTVYRCRHCTRAIFSDHGLGRYNLDAHEMACLDQLARARARAVRKASARYRRQFRRSIAGLGSDTVPGVGQLGFPFEGVPVEVTG